MVADRRRGIHHDHRKTTRRELQGDLLRQELRPFVRTGHMFQPNRPLFISDAAGRNSDAADGTCVNQPLHSSVAGGPQNVAGTVHIRTIQIVRIRRPQPVIGCNVKNQSAAGYRVIERNTIPQITGYLLYIQFADLAARPD